MLYEIWSVGKKPFEQNTNQEVIYVLNAYIFNIFCKYNEFNFLFF